MAKYRKKPVVVDAAAYKKGMEDGVRKFYTDGAFSHGWKVNENGFAFVPYIETLQGMSYISPGDYIITGLDGERYPCKLDVFEASYELMESIKGGNFDKFIVIKTEDVYRYLPEHDKIDLAHITRQIYEGIKRHGKKPNTYLVINTDEPYADQVVDILKANGHWG